MFLIQLNNLSFKAYHGLYPEEQIIGGTFIVNLSINVLIKEKEVIAIDETVNYEMLFETVSLHMQQPTALLENLTKHIADDILKQFHQVQEINISITKKNPPIKKFCGDVTVSYTRKRK